MPVRTHLRRLLHVTLAVAMALGLLHGASMDYADAATRMQHVTPHDPHAHHLAMHVADGHDMAGHAQHEPDTSSDEHHSKGALPGCPLASVVAIQPSVQFDVLAIESARIALHKLAPLHSTDPALLDPPPRAAA